MEKLREFSTIRVAYGVWHIVALIEVENGSSDSLLSENSITGKLTWGMEIRANLVNVIKHLDLPPSL